MASLSSLIAHTPCVGGEKEELVVDNHLDPLFLPQRLLTYLYARGICGCQHL